MLDPTNPRHRAIRSAQRLARLLELGSPSTIIQHEIDLLNKRVEEVINESRQEPS